jgi:hypothetical protein
MMKKSTILFVVLTAGHGVSTAGYFDWFLNLFSTPPIDYGAWECQSCVIPAPGTPVTAQEPAGVNAFVRANNREIHDSKNELIHRWIPNSTITVCDSNTCILLKYVTATALWLPIVPPTPRGNRPVTVPRIPDVANSEPGFIDLVEVTPIGPAPDPAGDWSVYVPWDIPSGRPLNPSITVNELGPAETSFFGPAIDLPPWLEPEIGEYNSWSPDCWGLDDFPYYCP